MAPSKRAINLLSRILGATATYGRQHYFQSQPTSAWFTTVNHHHLGQFPRPLSTGGLRCLDKNATKLILQADKMQACQQARSLVTTNRRCSMSSQDEEVNSSTLLLTRPQRHVASVELHNPKAKNAFSLETADELTRLMDELDCDPSVRCILISGSGPDLTSGVDIKSFMVAYGGLQAMEDVAHRAFALKRIVERFQAPFKRMHTLCKPIICVQHGLCLGLGMELAACADVRYCTRDTRMAIREVLIGIAADVGSLQLMPRLVSNQSLLAELIYSGRYITIEEAHRGLNFVSRVFETKEEAIRSARELAATIASRSPVAVRGSKRNMQFSREHSFNTGLDYNAVWNSAMMQGEDVAKAIGAILSKQQPGEQQEVDYEDL